MKVVYVPEKGDYFQGFGVIKWVNPRRQLAGIAFGENEVELRFHEIEWDPEFLMWARVV